MSAVGAPQVYLISEANGPDDPMLDEVDLQLRCLNCKCTLSDHVCSDSTKLGADM